MIDLRPSQSGIWVPCAAFPRFAAPLPEEPESDPSREGTCAAWVAEKVLSGRVILARDLMGETHPNGWLVTPDMVDHVQGYINHVRRRGGDIGVERFVRLNDFIAGTLDCSSAIMGDLVCVDDLKYGYGIVEPDHPQPTIYAGSLYMELIRANRHHTVKRIQVGIYQPRAAHADGIYRTVVYTPQELMTEIDRIVARGTMCQEPQSIATPGSHCKHCPARFNCEALTHSVYSMSEIVSSSRQTDPTSDEIAHELEFLTLQKELVDARLNAVSTQGEHIVKRGGHLPGWYLKESFGHRKFTVKPEVRRAITGINPFKDKERSPKEMEAAGASIRAVKAISTTPTIGRKLAKLPADFHKKALQK